jgi:hypothetical protein
MGKTGSADKYTIMRKSKKAQSPPNVSVAAERETGKEVGLRLER